MKKSILLASHPNPRGGNLWTAHLNKNALYVLVVVRDPARNGEVQRMSDPFYGKDYQNNIVTSGINPGDRVLIYRMRHQNGSHDVFSPILSRKCPSCEGVGSTHRPYAKANRDKPIVCSPCNASGILQLPMQPIAAYA